MSNDSTRVPADATEEQHEGVATPAGSETAANERPDEESAAPDLGVEELEQRIAPVQMI